MIRELHIVSPRPAQLLPGLRVNLPVDQLIRPAFHHLTRAESQCLSARTPPPARRLTSLSRVDVIAASRPLGLRVPCLILPDIAEVKAGRGSDDDSHPDLPGLDLGFDPELTMIVSNAMVCSG
jgi:hypothetical protein